jgi:GNAT superfamily N-acetyltransferase
MKIFEYRDVDPVHVLQLNLLGLGFALTPERVALIRRLDPRPFPFFALYAVQDGTVAGQVGVFRLPTGSKQGPEDVGGVWAVCTHPAFKRQGTATRLLDEAHARMRAAGLRLSTLGTSRHRVAHALYLRHGYEDVVTYASAVAQRSTALRDAPLRAERAGVERLHLVDSLFRQAAVGKLGFARRHEPFVPMMVETGEVAASEVWLLWEHEEPVGYALAKASDAVLTVRDILPGAGQDVAAAVAALARESDAPYIHVRVSRPSHIISLQRAGYRLAVPIWSTFMLKPLTDDLTTEDACQLFGIGTEQFLMSVMDIT